MTFIHSLSKLLLLGAIVAPSSFAIEVYSKQAGEAYRKLPDVKKGGTLYLRQQSNPKVLNPLLNTDQDYKDILSLLLTRLMDKDFESNDYFPLLAEKLEVSNDHKTMTYTLREGAIWEDGTPVTSDDAEFTFKTLMDPKVEAAPLRSLFDTFKFEKLDARKFKITCETPNVGTLDEINDDFTIMQKKQFDGVVDFNKAKGIIAPIGNGPYKLKSFSRDQKVEFERKKDWWGYKIPAFKNQHNFDNLIWRIIPDNALAYEKLIKGDIDVMRMDAEAFGTRVKGADKDKFGKDATTDKALWAEHFRTKMPAQWTYIGWNIKHPMFGSKKTRQGLAMLINYDEIIEKVYHGEAIRCLSPFGTSTPNTAPDQKSRAFQFNTSKALQYLKEDGWSDLDHDNVLAKMIEGKKVRFEFTLKYNSENPMRAKVAQMIKEQFKKAGIIVNIQAPEFNALMGMMENHDYDAIVMGWGGGSLNSDSKQIYHSKSYENKGSNYGGYSNPEVDKLIDKASQELSVQKHFVINQKIGAMIYDDQPYAFIMEMPGFMAAFQTRKVAAKKWVMKYDNTIPVGMYSAP